MSAERPAAGSAGVALVIDDEEPVRHVLGTALERRGFEVRKACDGQSGLEVFASREHWDVVVLDFGMPDLDGGEVLERLRAARPGVPVVLTSGYANPKIATVDESCTRFLHKPFGADELIRTVEELVAGCEG